MKIDVKRLVRDGNEVAYQYVKGRAPCVIFCAGFRSTMQGTKALALEQFCMDKGQAYIRFDYFAHGDSNGDFSEGSITTWLADTVAIIDQVAKSDVVLVGSSMGAWLALLAALKRTEQVKGLLLLACAADMTKYYPERIDDLHKEVDSQGRVFYALPNEYDNQEPYKIYQRLIDDGEQYFLLGSPINLDIPIHLIHGQDDDVVPWQRSQQVLDRLVSKNASLHLIKNGDHRLSNPESMRLLTSLLGVVCELSSY